MYAKSGRTADIRQKMPGSLCFLRMATLVHVTHEAVQQAGGIGTVLRGLITARSYRAHCQRTILLGPLTEPDSAQPLGPDGEILYDASRSIRAADVADQLSAVERKFGVRLVYGRRSLTQDGRRAAPEVLLVDVSRPPRRLNEFKRDLFLQFGLESHRYEQHWEYEQYLRLAEPGFAAVRSLVGDAPFLLLAHEFMGLGTAFKALMSDAACKTLFYAHEVATVRPLVEERPGRDIAFYNALRQARANGQYIDELFGPQDGYFKHALVSQAWRLDAVLAVGDWVVEELRFLGPEFAVCPIDLVYNGVPAAELSAAEREAARKKVQTSGSALLGWTPDLIFTHVARLVESKGLWRDLLVLEHLDRHLWKRGRRALFIALATETGRRDPEDIQRMAAYGWPLVHREGGSDLSSGELKFDLLVRAFNARTRAVKALFVNQFGWDQQSCGAFLPANAEFADLRRGSDAEFGQSIYEPFGISQVECLSSGTISVVSDVCGCRGFVRQAAGEAGLGGFIEGAYTQLDEADCAGQPIGVKECTQAEALQSQVVASTLASQLSAGATGRKRLLAEGYAAAQKMSWERVAEDMLLPILRRLEK